MKYHVEEVLQKHKDYVLHPEASGMSLQEAYELRGELLTSMFVLFPFLYELACGNCELTDKEARQFAQRKPDSVSCESRLDGIKWVIEDTLAMFQAGCTGSVERPMWMKLVVDRTDVRDCDDT